MAAMGAKGAKVVKGAKGKGADKMWQGRFQGGMASSMERLSLSLHFDRKLFREDIEGSMAHAHGLKAAGVLTGPELKKMLAGLERIKADLEAGKDLFASSDEDIHMAVERVLSERIGALGKKLHTGRSRNDQVATDLKLYVRRRAAELETLAKTCLGGQPYFAQAHVVIALAGRFARNFWKYRNHAKAYRAVILDAGHLSQTLYLAATELGLGAFVTAGVNEVQIEEAFGLEAMAEGPLAMCGFGIRAAERCEVEFDPNHAVWKD